MKDRDPGTTSSTGDALSNITEAATRVAALVTTARAEARKGARGEFTGGPAELAKNEYINGLNNIFGYYFDGTTPFASDHGIQQALYSGNNNVSVSSRKLQTMQTSTGRVYLVLNSVIGIQPTMMGNTLFVDAEDWIYALPLIPEEINGDPSTKGSVARVDKNGVPDLEPRKKTYQLPTEYAHMPQAKQPAIRVGGDNPIPGGWVEDMFVQGDSVYMVLAGPNNATRGMYKSTALFDKDGFIMAWTQAERVMGVVERMEAAGLDTQTGNFYALSGDGNVGRISGWGKGDAKLHGGEDKLLSTVLEKIFPTAQGGVHHYVQFDRFEPGFAQGAFAMSVAIGRDKIALIETGHMGTEGFEPTKEFVEGETVKVIDAPELRGIAPLTSVIMTTPDAAAPPGVKGTEPRMIVGGFGGMVKLDFGPDELSSVKNAVVGAAARFPNVNFKEPVYMLRRGKSDAAGNDRIHVLRESGFVSYAEGATDPAGDAKDPHNIPNPVDLVSLVRPALDTHSSAIIVSRNGLHTSFDLTALGSVSSVPHGIVHVQYLSENKDKRASVPGNLYVLAHDKRYDIDEETGEEKASSGERAYQVFRYAVTHKTTAPVGLNVDPIDTDEHGRQIPYMQFDDDRSGITVDGTLLFNQLPKDVFVNDFLRLVPMGERTKDNLDTMREDEQLLIQDLVLDAGLHGNISRVSRDPSSGAWVVPGDWGVRVNE